MIADLKDDPSGIAAFNAWAMEFVRTGPQVLESALFAVDEIAERGNYGELKAWASVWRGWMEHDKSNFSKALSYHLSAADFFEQNGNNYGLGRVANGIAASYKYLGMFDHALQWTSRALAASGAAEDRPMIAGILANLGETLIHLNRYAEAKEHLRRALESNPSEETQIVVSLRLAELAIFDGDSAKAIALIEPALQLAQRLETPQTVADASSVMANAMLLAGNIAEAKQFFVKATKIASRIGDKLNLAVYHLGFGRASLAKGSVDEALVMFHLGLEKASEVKARYIEAIAHLAISDAYRSQGKWKEAFEHKDTYHGIHTTLFTENAERLVKDVREDRSRSETEIYRRMYDRITAIGEAGRQITSVLDIASILNRVYEVVQRIMPADVFGIARQVEAGSALDYALMVERGVRLDVGRIEVSDGSSFGAWCYRHASEVFVNDLDTEAARYVHKELHFGEETKSAKSLICCPLMVAEKPIGIVTVQSYKKHAYTTHDLDGLRALASYIAIALENSRLYHEVNELATRDMLTGILNRMSIFKAGKSEFSRMRRNKTACSVLMIDLDGFKSVNDSFGHAAGDAILKGSAAVLTGAIRTIDLLGRYGGEEFLLILPETESAGAAIIAERLRTKIAATNHPIGDGRELCITASFGLYTFGLGEKDFEAGVNAADRALYQAKAQGKNRVSLIDGNSQDSAGATV